MSGFISVPDLLRACLAAAPTRQLQDQLTQCFKEPAFFLKYNSLGFYTAVEKDTYHCYFLLPLEAARKLVRELEDKLQCNLSTAQQAVDAAPQHNWAKYDSIQSVYIKTEAMYRAIENSFAKLSKESKSQALYSECRLMLLDATSMAQPLPSQQLHRYSGDDGRQATMFLSLDFEWWEKSHDYILEVGYSLWDNVTQRHRTRHWVIRENLNKCNGRHVTDNRMRFMFGTSEKASYDAAMSALQAEVDENGITDGLTRQEQTLLRKAGVRLVLVGHGMSQDLEHVKAEIEMPTDMPVVDTQKLYLAHQLKRLDAASAATALADAVTQEDKKDEAAPLLGTEQDLGIDSDTDDYEILVPMKQDDAAKRRAKGEAKGGKGGANGAAVDASGLILVKTVQQQLPKKVRPWPAGPAPEDEKPAPADDEAAYVKDKDKLDRQIGLAGLLSALGIKYSKLHNAGNDARFTMEALLAMAGHRACTDPLQAHIDSLNNDDSYRRGIEESMQAAAAQGWGTPTYSRPTTPASTEGTVAPAWGAGGGGGGQTVGAAASRLAQGSGPGGWTNGSECVGSAGAWGSGPPGFAMKGQPAAWPGFAGAAVTGPGAAAARGHPAVPPGYAEPPAAAAPAAAAPAPASNSWAARAANNRASSSSSSSTNAWGDRGAATTGPWAAGPAANGSKPPPAAAKAQGSWGAAPAAKQPSSNWDSEPQNAGTGGSGWGPPAPKQSGRGAFNSSTNWGTVTQQYAPNPDGW